MAGMSIMPITRTDPGHDCIDLNGGEVIFWDEEELANGASDKVWTRSFVPSARASLPEFE